MSIEAPEVSHARPAIEFSCERCLSVVRICQCCWRNQRYCSQDCATEARRERHRKNQKSYRKTDKGRASHIAQQRVYRDRKKVPRVIDLQKFK
jgi:hypothetical protein